MANNSVSENPYFSHLERAGEWEVTMEPINNVFMLNPATSSTELYEARADRLLQIQSMASIRMGVEENPDLNGYWHVIDTLAARARRFSKAFVIGLLWAKSR